MTRSIGPDLPFKNSFGKILIRSSLQAFLVFFALEAGRFYRAKPNDISFREGFPGYLYDHFQFLLWFTLFFCVIWTWYYYNKIKRIKEVKYEQATDQITLTYTNLLGRKQKTEIIKKQNLEFKLDKTKAEAEISNTLTEPYLLNKSTGFSLERLLELEKLLVTTPVHNA
jgi:hypothetical protein